MAKRAAGVFEDWRSVNVCGAKEWWRLSINEYDVMHHDFAVLSHVQRDC